MRRSIVLFELIISMLLLSIITLFSMQFYQQLHEINKSELQQQLHAVQMQSTKLFLDHLFQKSLYFQSASQRVQFFETDHNAFLQGLYSGVVNIQNSSKQKLHTPLSQITKLKKPYAVYFNKNHWYEIASSTKDEYIFFKDPNKTKTIYEHYHIIKRRSSVYLSNNTLFYNHQILLENVSDFKLSIENEHLNMTLCHQNQCSFWRFQL